MSWVPHENTQPAMTTDARELRVPVHPLRDRSMRPDNHLLIVHQS